MTARRLTRTKRTTGHMPCTHGRSVRCHVRCVLRCTAVCAQWAHLSGQECDRLGPSIRSACSIIIKDEERVRRQRGRLGLSTRCNGCADGCGPLTTTAPSDVGMLQKTHFYWSTIPSPYDRCRVQSPCPGRTFWPSPCPCADPPWCERRQPW